MDTKRKKGLGWWLLLIILISGILIGGKGLLGLWTEHSSRKENRVQLSAILDECQKETEAMMKAETMAKDIADENERLRVENAALELLVKDCKRPPETKSGVVPPEKKPRTPKPKEKALASQKAVAPSPPAPQEEILEQTLSRACGGPVRLDKGSGTWHCDKQERVAQIEPTPPVAEPDDFFANAVDEEIGEQVTTPMGNIAAMQVPMQFQPYCPAYFDSNGMTVYEGYRRVPGGGRVRCK